MWDCKLTIFGSRVIQWRYVFVNTRMNGEITLDNKTTFYIKKSPGYLNIKFDKVKNSDEAYVKVKAILDRIGEVVR